MKKFLLLLLVPFLFSSCTSLEGDNYSKFNGWVNISETQIPDSAVAGQQILITAKAMAPNGCWSDLNFFLTRQNVDTLYTINAMGLYESYDGICAQVAITADTTFKFTPDSAGLYVFISQSVSLEAHIDTMVVTNPSAKAR